MHLSLVRCHRIYKIVMVITVMEIPTARAVYETDDVKGQ